MGENNEDSDVRETECRPGIFFRSRKAQWLASPKLLAVNFGLLNVIHGMSFMYFIGTMTTFERHFQLKSEALGQVLSVAEVFPIAVNLICSYIGIRADRPRMIGGAALITALGYFLHGLPYFIFGPPNLNFLQLDKQQNQTNSRICTIESTQSLVSGNQTEQCVQEFVSEHGTYAVWISALGKTCANSGQLVMTIVGMAYLDDNVQQKNSPFYIAITSVLRTIGPLIGFMMCSFCLSFYVDLQQTDLKPTDPQWVGAWWLGFIIMAPTMAFGAFCIAQFPQRMPSHHATPAIKLKMTNETEVHKEMTYSVEALSRWTKIQNTVADFFRQLWRLFKNRHWLLRALSGAFTLLALEGYTIYSPKYLEHAFHLTPSQASVWTGSAIIAPMILGQLCMGFYMKYFTPSARKLSFLIAFCKIFLAITVLSLMFLRCSAAYTTGIHDTSSCEVNCECPSLPFQPVCVDGSRNFLSGCHAGCTTVNKTADSIVYTNCSCGEDSIAVPNFCSADCSTFPYYILLSSLGHFTISCDIVGFIFMFRCVPIELKALAFGLYEATLSVLVFIPVPMIFSAIIDQTCILWNWSCNERGACLLYDIDQFRYFLHGIPFVLVLVACVFDFLFAIKAHQIDLYGEKDKIAQNPR